MSKTMHRVESGSYSTGKVHMNFYSGLIHSMLEQYLFQGRLIIGGCDKVKKGQKTTV